MSDDFEEQNVLEVPVNEETTETFCIADCVVCDEEITTPSVYVWGYPRGGYVSLWVHCSRTCVDESIRDYSNEVQKDIILIWRSLA